MTFVREEERAHWRERPKDGKREREVPRGRNRGFELKLCTLNGDHECGVY